MTTVRNKTPIYGKRPFKGWPELVAVAAHTRDCYCKWLGDKLEVYEMMTGRQAVGVLLIAVGKENMLEETAIPMTLQSARDAVNVKLQVYSCVQLGFHPGAVSAALF